MERTSPVAGARFSKLSPEAASISSPAITLAIAAVVGFDAASIGPQIT